MCNANPKTLLSWAGLFLHYGCCQAASHARSADNLPWHNTSFKRRHLVAYGDRLADILIVEGILFNDLRAKGQELRFEPGARTHHLNISLPSSWVRQAFWGGRLFGALRARAENWPAGRRLLHAAGSPLVPLVRLRRTLRQIDEAGQRREMWPRILPALLSGLVCHAAGEAVGYALGPGPAPERYSYFEMRRTRHITARDRAALGEE